MEEDGLALQPMPTIHFFPVSSCYSSPRSDPAVATTNSSKKVVAAAVASDLEKYNEAFLGRPNEAYIVLGFWTLRSGEAKVNEVYGLACSLSSVEQSKVDIWDHYQKMNN